MSDFPERIDRGEVWAGYSGDSDDRVIISSHGRILRNGRELKQHKSDRGYMRVTVGGKTVPVHRLVALHFIPNPEMRGEINHIDGDKGNNHVDNLEWSTGHYIHDKADTR